MIKQFTICETVEGFTRWINDYGTFKQSHFIPTDWHLVWAAWHDHPTLLQLGNVRDLCLIYVINDPEPGFIEFVIGTLTSKNLKITARLTNANCSEMNSSEVLVQHFNDLCEAIQQTYDSVQLVDYIR
jgi:hypothetical protein